MECCQHNKCTDTINVMGSVLKYNINNMFCAKKKKKFSSRKEWFSSSVCKKKNTTVLYVKKKTQQIQAEQNVLFARFM